jgi:hypothetical protein
MDNVKVHPIYKVGKKHILQSKVKETITSYVRTLPTESAKHLHIIRIIPIGNISRMEKDNNLTFLEN